MRLFLRKWKLFFQCYYLSFRNKLKRKLGKITRSKLSNLDSYDLSPSKSYLYYAKLIENGRNLTNEEYHSVVSQSEQRHRLKDLIKCRRLSSPVSSIESLQAWGDFNRIRTLLSFDSEQSCPIEIVTHSTQDIDGDLPLMICMQGYNSGAHLSLGEIRQPYDVYKVDAGSAIALQAAELGFRVISYERPCFGERKEKRIKKPIPNPTVDAVFSWLMMGRTLIGETVSELVSVIDWAQSKFRNADKRIFLSGYSAAGTTAIFTSALDERVSGIAVGGCVGMLKDTVMQRGTGGYVAIPDLLLHFEFDSILSLIAPRICVVVSGTNDHIYPYYGAETCISSARKHFKKINASDALVHKEVVGGHTYYPDVLWPSLVETMRCRGISF